MTKSRLIQQSSSEEDSFHLEEFPETESDEDQQYQQKRYYVKRRKGDKRKGKKGKNKSQFNQSLWNLQENLLYRDFLINNQHLFQGDRFQRKLLKVNVRMSQIVISRSPDQCRSHHQKMMKHHTNIPSIISHINSLQANSLDGINTVETPSTQSNLLDKVQIPLRDLISIEVKGSEESLWNTLIIQNNSFWCYPNSL